jgi:outer membrane protein assembly factor BamD (BamD/ComL family)
VLAQKHLADEDFEEAADLYRQIVNSCGAEDDKAFYEFQLCTSLFYAAPPADLVPQLDSFIHRYRTSHPGLTREATMMKARLYLQSRRLDEALVQFKTVGEHAGTERACEAAFFIAYCTMLKGELAAATGVLNAVVEDYPETQWARRARLCLAYMNDMSAKETLAN